MIDKWPRLVTVNGNKTIFKCQCMGEEHTVSIENGVMKFDNHKKGEMASEEIAEIMGGETCGCYKTMLAIKGLWKFICQESASIIEIVSKGESDEKVLARVAG